MTRLKNPIYCQINDKLRELIRGGEFKAGDKFPAEREIGERFSVSRVTANKVVSNLVAEACWSSRRASARLCAAACWTTISPRW
jgi:GntR family transcriptional regulator